MFSLKNNRVAFHYSRVAGSFVVLAAALSFAISLAYADSPNLSAAIARSSPDWLRTGTIYEIFPRDFSPEGNFNGVTAKLDDIKALGVNVLWIMPIHPIGEKGRKGDFGSPYASKIITPSIRITER
jgi:cyclomaltodextrinase / maltogenic alpha-amylase / neopullulanase